VFADGGLWANNPVLLGLIEALDVAEAGREIQIFSLGTCPVPQGEQIPRGDRHRGLPEWKFGGNAASLSVDAQEFVFDHMARKLTKHVNRKCSIVRFPHDKVPATLVPYLSLDDTREEAMNALITQARTDADMTNSKGSGHVALQLLQTPAQCRLAHSEFVCGTVDASSSRHHGKQAKQIPACLGHALVLCANAFCSESPSTNDVAGPGTQAKNAIKAGSLFILRSPFNKIDMAFLAVWGNMRSS